MPLESEVDGPHRHGLTFIAREAMTELVELLGFVVEVGTERAQVACGDGERLPIADEVA